MDATRSVRNAPVLLVISAFIVLFLGSLVVSIWPEPEAKILTPVEQFRIEGSGQIMPLARFPDKNVQVRNSLRISDGMAIIRNYTPQTGTGPMSVRSPEFKARGILSVLIAGDLASRQGTSRAFIGCTTHLEMLPVANGNLNTNVSEAFVRIPRDWCQGQSWLQVDVLDKTTYAGVGPVSSVSYVTWLKRGFLGVFTYWGGGSLVVGLIGFATAVLLRRIVDPVIGAMGGIGAVALGTFFVFAVMPAIAALVVLPGVIVVAVALIAIAGPATRRDMILRLQAPALVWTAVSFLCFALLMAGYNGVGHWEPNARFAPAIWSSDNQLPWFFAEALRNGYDLPSLFGGAGGKGWSPTDRPPLLTGGHLLLSSLFAVLQSIGNDGNWLRGSAYNASAIVFNSLWAPVALYILTDKMKLSLKQAVAVVALIAMTPFAMFNTIFGWGKLLGGAFALIATSVAIFEATRDRWWLRDATVFGIACALSILSHSSNALFLVPVAVWFFLSGLWRKPFALTGGVVAGLAFLLPWSVYQTFAVHSYSPLIKFALTGDYGFGRPEVGVRELLAERYADNTIAEIVAFKLKRLLSAFMPIQAGVADMKLRDWVLYDALGRLRQWDFFYLSAGNLPLIAGFLALLTPAARKVQYRGAALIFGGFALAGYLFCVAIMTPALIVHSMPYGLLLVLGLGSVSLLAASRIMFRTVFIILLAYMTVVWFLLPLRNSLYVDVPAILMFASVAALGAIWAINYRETGKVA